MSKKPKSKGAFKHGAYAQEVILPGEDRRDYALMLAELYDEWAPEGLTERELVDRLAALYWRRRRAHLYQQAKLQRRVVFLDHHRIASETNSPGGRGGLLIPSRRRGCSGFRP